MSNSQLEIKFIIAVYITFLILHLFPFFQVDHKFFILNCISNLTCLKFNV